MLFTYEMNKLMLIDGVLFVIPGINLMLFPSPRKRVDAKLDTKTVLPLFKDVRIALGASYFSTGLTMVSLSGIIENTNELNTFAIFRCISLIFIVLAMALQIVRKKWKPKGDFIMYLIFYSILIVLYGYLGFIDPLPLQG